MSTQPLRIGKYEMRERLGRGGMAEVWKAFDEQLQRYVAIKLMHANLQDDPEFMTRFVREARAIASLHHPNIIQIYDFQTTDTADSNSPLAYMVMDYVEGQTLADFMRETVRVGTFLAPNELVSLLIAISRAIDYAHQHSMLHRDIKPANILLDKRNTRHNSMGEPILSDFGIAKLVGISGGTMNGAWLGTPMYVAPEQVQGQPGDERSDIYSLGIILYELCTGVTPFRGDTITNIILQHVTKLPTDPSLVNPSVPPALSQAILRTLAKDPADRFGSASALTAAVAEALNIPVPADIQAAAAVEAEEMDAPTYLMPSRLEEEMSQLPTIASSNNVVQVAASPQVQFSTRAVSKQAAETPGSSTPAISPHATIFSPSEQSSSQVAPVPSAVTPIPPVSPPTPPKRNRRGLFIALIALVILVVAGSTLGAFFLFNHTTSPVNTSVGNVSFMSSEHTDINSSAGMNDELQVNLHNLAQPATGNAMYAWLLSDTSMTEAASLFVGKLTVANGGVQLRYSGDAQHTNLLVAYSRFLVTEEPASPTPLAPTVDRHAWRYYAELPQTPSKVDNFSLLDHLRHLLAKDPELDPLNLPGGLEIWLYRNTQGVMQRADKAQTCWHAHDSVCVQHSIIRVLDYLDSKNYVSKDVPQGTPLLIDPRLVSVALLQLDPNQSPPSYLYHINRHLQGIVQAPGATATQQQLANQIDTGLNILSASLQKVYQNAQQLIKLPTDQLLSNSTLTILNDMATQADSAFNGQLNPQTQQLEGGAVEIYRNTQRLATFTVMPYKP